MLTDKLCTVGKYTDRDRKGFTSFQGVIASEPHMSVDGDFFILVQLKGRLIRVDTDYIYDVEVFD